MYVTSEQRKLIRELYRVAEEDPSWRIHSVIMKVAWSPLMDKVIVEIDEEPDDATQEYAASVYQTKTGENAYCAESDCCESIVKEVAEQLPSEELEVPKVVGGVVAVPIAMVEGHGHKTRGEIPPIAVIPVQTVAEHAIESDEEEMGDSALTLSRDPEEPHNKSLPEDDIPGLAERSEIRKLKPGFGNRGNYCVLQACKPTPGISRLDQQVLLTISPVSKTSSPCPGREPVHEKSKHEPRRKKRKGITSDKTKRVDSGRIAWVYQNIFIQDHSEVNRYHPPYHTAVLDKGSGIIKYYDNPVHNQCPLYYTVEQVMLDGHWSDVPAGFLWYKEQPPVAPTPSAAS